MKKSHNRGFTLIETMVAFVLVGTLAAIAIPFYSEYKNKALVTRCILELNMIEKDIMSYMFNNDGFPDDLSDLGSQIPTDPWGNPYEYLKIEGQEKLVKGKMRKDKETGRVIYKVTKVCFTWALPEGMWVQYEDGYRDWESFRYLTETQGEEETERLKRVATRSQFTGIWYDA